MMGLKDIHSDSKGKIGLAQTTIATNTATNSAIIDMLGYEALEFFVSSGTVTDGVYALSLVHGDVANLSDGAAVPEEYILGASNFVLTDDNVCKRVGYIGHKRYCRLVITSTGVTTGGAFSVLAVNANPLHGPVPND